MDTVLWILACLGYAGITAVTVWLGVWLKNLVVELIREEKGKRQLPPGQMEDWRNPEHYRPKHKHSDLIEVDEHLTGEIVAYICGVCDAQVSLSDPAGQDLRKAKKILEGWNKITDTLDATGNQTVSQAERFALRSNLMEQQLGSGESVIPTDMLRSIWDRLPGWTEKDTFTARHYLQVVPTFGNFEKNMAQRIADESMPDLEPTADVEILSLDREEPIVIKQPPKVV